MSAINHNPHTPEAKTAKAAMLRRTAELRRRQASKIKDGAKATRMRNDATELEARATTIEAEVMNMTQGYSYG